MTKDQVYFKKKEGIMTELEINYRKIKYREDIYKTEKEIEIYEMNLQDLFDMKISTEKLQDMRYSYEHKLDVLRRKLILLLTGKKIKTK